jgi:gamma-glutamylcyclotransferase (GGCT)/AIG2-like uncharacterized protein YtfP
VNRQKYFAYGSNLNEDDLKSWCAGCNRQYPLGEKVAVGYLPDAQLAFNSNSPTTKGGVLSYLDGCPGHVVLGIVHEVDDAGLATLDLKVGATENGRGPYARKEVAVLTGDGRLVDAVTYQTSPLHADDFVAPDDEYVRVVRKGYLDHMLRDEGFLNASRNEPQSFLIPRLFTYGSLMRGECRNKCLFPDKVRLARSAVVRGVLLDLGSYPGMIAGGDECSQVLGEICDLDSQAETIRELDQLEGFEGYGKEGSRFTRAIITAAAAGGLEYPAWVYLYNQAGSGRIIPGGNWKERGARSYTPASAANICMEEPAWCIWATMNDLVCLKDVIESDDYKRLSASAAPWAGADVIITDGLVSGTNKTVVVTQCWRELSWLFGMLKEYFGWYIDPQNKYTFYRSLADTVMSFISEGGDKNASLLPGDRYAKDLMNRVVDSALCLLDDLDSVA